MPFSFFPKCPFIILILLSLSGCLGDNTTLNNCKQTELPTPKAGIIHAGDFEIRNEQTYNQAKQFASISGNLTITEGNIIELPNLTHVGGELRMDSTTVTHLKAPNVTEISGYLWLYLNLELLEIDFSSLEHVGITFINRNPRMNLLNFNSLTSIDAGDFNFTGQLDMPSCLVAPIEAKFGSESASGRNDCECIDMCGRLEAKCP